MAANPGQRAVLAVVAAVGCAEPPQSRGPTGLETIGLMSVEPGAWLPGTQVEVFGHSFLDQPLGISWLRLDGTFDGRPIGIELPATFVDYDHMRMEVGDHTFAELAARNGRFTGQMSLIVDYTPDGSRHRSNPVSRSFELREALEPRLDELHDRGVVFVNDRIAVHGDGLLLPGEGETVAVVQGCVRVTPDDACRPIDPVEVPVTPDAPFARDRGTFPFSPEIAGIRESSFEGEVRLENVHAGGSRRQSEARSVHYELREAVISSIGAGGSMGQYVEVRGLGFVDQSDDSVTYVELAGDYRLDSDAAEPLPIDGIAVVPQFAGGQLLRYVVNEGDAVADALELYGGVRYATGTFEGTVRPIVSYRADEVVGEATPVSFRIEPVKQVVWVDFTPAYVESLRAYGLRALDTAIRERVLDVMARDYAGINLELRTEEPDDFDLYTIVEIAGEDPNQQGLLGYDNTPGKDFNNERLHDRIGSFNAQTEAEGFAAYGGVFVESMFTFSSHPPAGLVADAPSPLFDAIFDPLREDRGGRPVSSTDDVDGGITVPDSGAACPGTDRPTQVACAVWTLGSLIGTTASHELGHALGLAQPMVTNAFHNLGDGPSRLMDAGAQRPFEERAELGDGPGVFCESSYQYLRNILPTGEPSPDVERPPC